MKIKKKNRTIKSQLSKNSEMTQEKNNDSSKNQKQSAYQKRSDIIDTIKPELKGFAGLIHRKKALFITIGICMAVLFVIICIIMTPSGRKSSYKADKTLISAPTKPKFIPPPPVIKKEEKKKEITSEEFTDSIINLLSNRSFSKVSSLLILSSEKSDAIPLTNDSGFEDRTSIFEDGLDVYFGKTNSIYPEKTTKVLNEDVITKGNTKIKLCLTETSFIEAGSWNSSKNETLNRQICRFSLIYIKGSWKIAGIETKNEIPEAGAIDNKTQEYGYEKEDTSKTESDINEKELSSKPSNENIPIQKSTQTSSSEKIEVPQIIIPQGNAPETNTETVEGNETGTAGGSVE